MLSKISKKIFNSERISIEEGIWLLKESELLDLIPLANYWSSISYFIGEQNITLKIMSHMS